MKSNPKLIVEMEMLLYLQEKRNYACSNVSANPFCNNVKVMLIAGMKSTCLFVECKPCATCDNVNN